MRLCQWLPLHGGQLFLLSIIGSAFVWHDVDYDSEQSIRENGLDVVQAVSIAHSFVIPRRWCGKMAPP